MGNALIKSKNKKKIFDQQYFESKGVERKDIQQKAKLESCVDQNALQDFLYKAELAQKDFEGQQHKEIKINAQ